MLVLVDVDSVIADLMPAWLRLYNHDYDDCLVPEDFTDWDMTKFVKPECGNLIYRYLERASLYDKVEVIESALYGVYYLRSQGHRVVFATSGVYTMAKFRWLERNKFDPGRYAEDYVVIYDKALLRGDILIDDRSENIRDFNMLGGNTILFNQPWNKDFNWCNRAYNWEDVIRIFRDIYE